MGPRIIINMHKPELPPTFYLLKLYPSHFQEKHNYSGGILNKNGSISYKYILFIGKYSNFNVGKLDRNFLSANVMDKLV